MKILQSAATRGTIHPLMCYIPKELSPQLQVMVYPQRMRTGPILYDICGWELQQEYELKVSTLSYEPPCLCRVSLLSRVQLVS